MTGSRGLPRSGSDNLRITSSGGLPRFGSGDLRITILLSRPSSRASSTSSRPLGSSRRSYTRGANDDTVDEENTVIDKIPDLDEVA